jgi:aryl-alcohol dehydrogenase-like predicted oxidoreductase
MYADDDFAVVDEVCAVAEERNVSPAQVALAWLLSKPSVTAPVVGATQLRHIDEALAALELDLSEPEISQLEKPYRPHGILGHT